MYKFSKGCLWFNNCKDDFAHYLSKYTNQPANFLEIGCFEGKCSTWLLDNVLTHPGSRLTCIDTWDLPGNTFDMFMHNIWRHNNVTIMHEYSAIALRRLDDEFDFIYIDADHTDYYPLENAVLAFPLLKAGGIMCFDDYEWDKCNVKESMDAFLTVYKAHYTLLKKEYQIWIRKNDCQS